MASWPFAPSSQLRAQCWIFTNFPLSHSFLWHLPSVALQLGQEESQFELRLRHLRGLGKTVRFDTIAATILGFVQLNIRLFDKFEAGPTLF